MCQDFCLVSRGKWLGGERAAGSRTLAKVDEHFGPRHPPFDVGVGCRRARASGLSECPGGVSEEGQPLPAATLHPVYSLVGAVCPTGLGVRSTPDCRSFLGFEPSCTEQLVALPTLSCRAAQALRPCVGTRRWRRVPPPGCARLGPCMPFQFGLSTRAGTEALFKLLQVATKCNSRTTVLSVDAIGAARGAAFVARA